MNRFEVEQDPKSRDTYYLNMGPQHPSTHGVMRIKLHLDGERIISAEPIIGYGHRAHEKMAENRDYIQFLPNPSRVDYLGGMIYNIGYCQAVERAMDIEIPERAEYIRIICNELNRISSHLLWLGTFLMDLGAFTPFLYAFDDREKILDILDRITGSRLTYCYARFGGVILDIDDIFLDNVSSFCTYFVERLKEYEKLVIGNVIFRERTIGVGIFAPDLVQKYAITGPCLRAMGHKHDVRRDEPYGIYDRFDFDVPTQTEGDCFARTLVRMEEMRQSIRIIEQAVSDVPDGLFLAARVPRRIRPPEGDYYFCVESPRITPGQLRHVHRKRRQRHPLSPQIANPIVFTHARRHGRYHARRCCSYFRQYRSTMPAVMAGTMLADAVAILGSIDIVVPEIDR